MPNPTLDKLAGDIRNDATLSREFAAISDVDELIDKTLSVAHDRGYDDVARTDIEAYISEAADRDALSEEALDQVAGGATCSSVLSCCCCV